MNVSFTAHSAIQNSSMGKKANQLSFQAKLEASPEALSIIKAGVKDIYSQCAPEVRISRFGVKSFNFKEQRKNLYVFLKKYGVRGEAPSSSLPPLKGGRGVDKKVKTFSYILKQIFGRYKKAVETATEGISGTIKILMGSENKFHPEVRYESPDRLYSDVLPPFIQPYEILSSLADDKGKPLRKAVFNLVKSVSELIGEAPNGPGYGKNNQFQVLLRKLWKDN